MYKTKELFDLEHTIAKDYLNNFEYPYLTIKGISELIIKLGKELDLNEYKEIKENVWIHNTAKIYPSAYIDGPCIIGKESEVRQSAFIRGSALVGNNCVVGNSSELKNVILFDNVQVPHFNYVGDSILGFKSHMGAGSITSNFKSDGTNVVIRDKEEKIETNLRKFGAIVGDHVEIGCNSVLNPGTIVGKNTSIYPLNSVRGVISCNSIYKNKDEIVTKK